ncbi:MAG: hypothetical protein PHP79_09610 [Clostridia bacterium]|jgi:putative aldouronate transport system substrate-binding protein|nr:hypothetical protein [Clostridia bacterium]
MKKRFFRLVCTMLVVMMILSLAVGCTTQPQGSTTTGTNATGTSQQGSSNEKVEPVKFSIMLRAGPDFATENNPWINQINERANAEITWIAVPTENIWDKRNVTMASNNYPEVIIMNTSQSSITDNLYEQMVKNKIILPIDEYVKNCENIMEFTHDVSWNAIRHQDGNVYMVPRCTIIREDFMGIRKDWREKLNIPVPETIEDWRAFYKAIATGDPDQNGKDDTYGVSDANEIMSYSGTINLDFFARAWHADKQWYDNGNGEVFYGMFAKDGRFKYALEFYRHLNEDKSLDPDLMTNKGNNSKFEKFYKGVVASARYFAGNLDRDLNTLRSLQPEAQAELVDFPTAPESAQYQNEKIVLTNAGIYNGWALTNKAKGKEQAIVNVFDWMLSDEGWTILKYGAEGFQHKKEGDKIIKLEPEYTNFSKWIGHCMLFRRPNDETFWLKNTVPEIYDYQKEWLQKSVKYIEDNTVQKGLLGIYSSNEVDFYKKDIFTKKFVEICAEIIYGEKPLDAWDEFIEEIYAEGWEEVTKEYNEYYKVNK